MRDIVLCCLLLAAGATPAVNAASPITGAFGINLGDPVTKALAQGFTALPDKPDRVGHYSKIDADGFMRSITLRVSPESGVVYGVEAWRLIEEDRVGIERCRSEFYPFLEKLKEKYPALVEFGNTRGESALERTLADGKRQGFMNVLTLSVGRSITIMCMGDREPKEHNTSHLAIWYSMAGEESAPYRAEVDAARKRLKDEAMTSAGFDAKDF